MPDAATRDPVDGPGDGPGDVPVDGPVADEVLAQVFKAYDVRGTVPDQLDAVFARALGGAVAEVLGGSGLVVGHDMRPSSPELATALADGFAARGGDVVQLGLCATDELYYASGSLDLPGVMITASHNPAHYNGFKLCRAGAAPVGEDTGLSGIREAMRTGRAVAADPPGRVRQADLLGAYVDHLLGLAPVAGRPLTGVVDAGNGMAGLTVPAVAERLAGRLRVVPLYFELDGSFPHHEANPIDPANLVDLQARVVAEGADLGLAFDGDADRCFAVDERGTVVSPSALTALIAARELAREPGAAIIHNVVTSRAVPEIVTELGGRPVRTRVGHSFIKATMARTGAVFGGEHSGHFYFRDFWRADSGLLAALHLLGALAGTDQTLSQLMSGYTRYVASGEINSTVGDPVAAVGRVRAAYAGRPDVTLDELDGLSVSHPDWAFNVRASNTEPLLRLNAEARDDSSMESVRDDVLELIRSEP